MNTVKSVWVFETLITGFRGYRSEPKCWDAWDEDEKLHVLVVSRSDNQFLLTATSRKTPEDFEYDRIISAIIRPGQKLNLGHLGILELQVE